jgi:polyisoprenoid-binding protein YceI
VWSSVARRVTVVLGEEHDDPDARLPALADEVGALRTDLRALAAALESQQGALATRLDEHAVVLERQIAAVRDEAGSRGPPSDELAGLVREPSELRGAAGASLGSRPVAQLVPPAAEESARAATASVPPAAGSSAQSVDPPATGPTVAAQGRQSFLAFRLPSDDFRFDERRTWTVIPALSRVGFDARSTLHDFSGVTSAVEGELAVDLAHPALEPRVRLRVEAADLATGDGRRDDAMREHLAVAEHASLEFELTRFEPSAVDAGARELAGTAHGRLRIRGVVRDVSMAVRLALDDAQRLCVEGSMPLDLEHFGVPVPSKLGLISMEKSVEVWISLRLRVTPRTDG